MVVAVLVLVLLVMVVVVVVLLLLLRRLPWRCRRQSCKWADGASSHTAPGQIERHARSLARAALS